MGYKKNSRESTFLSRPLTHVPIHRWDESQCWYGGEDGAHPRMKRPKRARERATHIRFWRCRKSVSLAARELLGPSWKCLHPNDRLPPPKSKGPPPPSDHTWGLGDPRSSQLVPWRIPEVGDGIRWVQDFCCHSEMAGRAGWDVLGLGKDCRLAGWLPDSQRKLLPPPPLSPLTPPPRGGVQARSLATTELLFEISWHRGIAVLHWPPKD